MYLTIRRLFRDGRTETVRSCTSKSCEWAKAMQNPGIQVCERINLICHRVMSVLLYIWKFLHLCTAFYDHERAWKIGFRHLVSHQSHKVCTLFRIYLAALMYGCNVLRMYNSITLCVWVWVSLFSGRRYVKLCILHCSRERGCKRYKRPAATTWDWAKKPWWVKASIGTCFASTLLLNTSRLSHRIST